MPARKTPGPLPVWLAPAVEAVLGDLQQPTSVALTPGYVPDDQLDNVGSVVFDEANGHWFGFGVTSDGPTMDLLIDLARGLQENFLELAGARPNCPGHRHPAQPMAHNGAAWWACPRDGRPLAPIGSLRPL
jgi:hypothetical protein